MNPAELSLTISPSLTKAIPSGSVAQKNVATLASSSSKTMVERVNLEPLYTALKSALGEAWSDYKDALSKFILGSYNQAELSYHLQPLLSSNPIAAPPTADATKPLVSTLQLHNSLLAAVYANTARDPPPTEVAPWVVATDKPVVAPKTAGTGTGANDKVEERLKREVMALHPRDRKRIKSVKETPVPINDGFREMQEYYKELGVKAPAPNQAQAEPQSATGSGPSGAGTSSLARTNFDIDIRRQFTITLASEALEFPTLGDIQSRIEPICYEEELMGGVQQGALQAVAELIEQASEVFVKEMLGNLLGHTRSNTAGGGGVQTNKFRRQLRKEEDDAERGIVQRNAAGLLPVEMEMQAKREPLDMQDLRLSVNVNDSYLLSSRFLSDSVMLSQWPEMDPAANSNGISFGHVRPLTNGNNKQPDRNGVVPDPYAMAVDEIVPASTFKGVAKTDRDNFLSALDECLLAG